MDYKTISKEEELRCLECGNEFEYGRTDKKFCCNLCKNRYHNKRNKDVRNMKSKVWHVLEKNHSILSKLVRMGIRSVELPKLATLGFDINYSTSYHKINRREEFTCFDIIYDLSPSKIFGIKRADSVNLYEELSGKYKDDEYEYITDKE